MTLELSHIIGIAGFFVTVMSLITAYVAKQQRAQANFAERLSVVETRMGLFWHSVEQHVAQMFKLPTHHRLDILIDRFTARTLTFEESRELDLLLQERLTYPDITPDRKIWGEIVRQGIRSYQIELQSREDRHMAKNSWWERFSRWWTTP